MKLGNTLGTYYWNQNVASSIPNSGLQTLKSFLPWNCLSLQPAIYISMQSWAKEGQAREIVENTEGEEGSTIGGVERKKHTERGDVGERVK